jgi:hypothetical protein
VDDAGGGVSATSSVSLVPFAHEWIGGDIHGLAALSAELASYVPAITDITTALTRRASQLTSGAPGSWQGSAATAFATSWHNDALAAAGLAMATGQASQITGALAVALSEIENALETQAEAAVKHGVQIMPGGQPGPEPFGPPASGTEVVQQQWSVSYQQVWQQAQAEANQARQQAATQLMRLYEKIAPRPQGPRNTTGNDYATLSDLLADVWAVPTASRREVNELIEHLEGRQELIERGIAAARNTGKLPPANTLKELSDVRAELAAANEELPSAGREENALTKLLDSRIGNVRDYLAGQAGPGEHVAGRTPAAIADATDDDAGLLGRLIDAGEAIPVVDVLAATAGTVLGVKEDTAAGKPIAESVAKEATANVVGLTVGAVVGGAIGGIPGAVIGGVVGYGVGDLTHNLLWEPWSRDMHTYGAVDGVLYGIGHSEFATVDDARGAALSLGHTAEHLWDKVF